jgi:hypothetical protein
MESSVTEKLRKLIAHEASARSIGSLSEAEAFAAKIQDMLITHKLSLSDIELDAEEHNEQIAEEYVTSDQVGRPYRSKSQGEMIALADVVARAFFCRLVSLSNSNTVIFIGREGNRRAAVDLYKLLAVIARRSFYSEFKAWKKTDDYKFRSGTARRRTIEFKYGYYLGFDRTIQLRFNTQQKISLGSGEKGLVLVQHLDRDVDNHLAKMNLHTSKSRVLNFNRAGVDAGDRRASNVSLTSKALI